MGTPVTERYIGVLLPPEVHFVNLALSILNVESWVTINSKTAPLPEFLVIESNLHWTEYSVPSLVAVVIVIGSLPLAILNNAFDASLMPWKTIPFNTIFPEREWINTPLRRALESWSDHSKSILFIVNTLLISNKGDTDVFTLFLAVLALLVNSGPEISMLYSLILTFSLSAMWVPAFIMTVLIVVPIWSSAFLIVTQGRSIHPQLSVSEPFKLPFVVSLPALYTSVRLSSSEGGKRKCKSDGEKVSRDWLVDVSTTW